MHLDLRLDPGELETAGSLFGGKQAEISGGYIYITREKITGSQVELMLPE